MSYLQSINAFGESDNGSFTKNVHILVEDATSGYDFWKFICSNIYKNVVVERMSGSGNIVNAIRNLTDYDTPYVIVLDYAFDNLSVSDDIEIITGEIERRKLKMLIC